LVAWAARGTEGVTLVVEVDGQPVRGSRWEPLLREAGFGGDYRGMVLSRKPRVAAANVDMDFAGALAAIDRAAGGAPRASVFPIGPWSTEAERDERAVHDDARPRFTFRRARGVARRRS